MDQTEPGTDRSQTKLDRAKPGEAALNYNAVPEQDEERGGGSEL